MDPTSVMGRRIGAYAIDAIIGSIVFIIALLAISEKVDSSRDLCPLAPEDTLCFHAGDTMFISQGGRIVAIFAVAIGFWMLIMGALIQGLAGGTPGKLMVGLRVVNQESGERAGFGRCLARSFMWIVDGQPAGVPLVALITGASTKGHRRVGDMVAKTLVVHKTSVGTPPSVPGLTTLPGTFTPGPPVVGPPPTAVADGISAPKWDIDRNAYIQWDPQLNQWMEFDDAVQQWKPISQ